MALEQLLLYHNFSEFEYSNEGVVAEVYKEVDASLPGNDSCMIYWISFRGMVLLRSV